MIFRKKQLEIFFVKEYRYKIYNSNKQSTNDIYTMQINVLQHNWQTIEYKKLLNTNVK